MLDHQTLTIPYGICGDNGIHNHQTADLVASAMIAGK